MLRGLQNSILIDNKPVAKFLTSAVLRAEWKKGGGREGTKQREEKGRERRECEKKRKEEDEEEERGRKGV
jgi:hypothetical protein